MVLSPTAVAIDYLGDLAKHYFSFWKENADRVCDDEEEIKGKIVIVTGSNTGIGKMIALQLAKREAKVIMAVRDLAKGQAALDDIKKLAGKEIDVEIMKLDLGDLQSIRDFVKEFETKHPHLNILVNNAGFMDTNGEVLKTKDGFEQHVGVNHLGPFLLTKLLLPSLKKGSPRRIVCVASSNIALVPLDVDAVKDVTKVKTGDDGKEQYSFSKMLNAVCVGKMVPELEKEGIKVYQLCPGYVKSDVFRNESGFLKKLKSSISLGVVGLTTHQGSETAVYCCVSKSVTESPESGKGEMYRFKKLWEKGNAILQDHVSSEKADVLYKMTKEMVGL